MLLLKALSRGAMHGYGIGQRIQQLADDLRPPEAARPSRTPSSTWGAQASDILPLVVRPDLRMAAVGIAAGLIASIAVSRVMFNLLFGVTPVDTPTFPS